MPAARTPATKAASVPEPVVIPPVPTVPSTWTPGTIAAFVGAVAAFVLGLLTMAGVTLPASVSTEVQTWAGILTSLAGALTPLWVLLSKHSILKAMIRSNGDVSPEAVRRLL